MNHPPADAANTPPGIDLEQPSAARIYDWYLGGDQNWAIDREFGRRMEELWPHARHGSVQNRRFMHRVVRAALDAGIRQFLDLGSGVPTVGNIHEICSEHLGSDDRATVAYVDYEPVAAAHGRLILERDEATESAALVQQDMRDPFAVLDDPEATRVLDRNQPICVLMIAVLHFVGRDDKPEEIISGYLDNCTSGSWFALSHMTVPPDPEAAAGVQRFADQYRNTANPVHLRSYEEIVPWFDGLHMLEPGITHLTDWRPETSPQDLSEADLGARPFAWCAVAEKP